MKKKRFSEEQIIRILKEGEALGNVREVCRQHNVTEQTYYRWSNSNELCEEIKRKDKKGCLRKRKTLTFRLV